MPLSRLASLTSNSGTTWYSTASRTDAITAAITGTATATSGLATNIGQAGAFWPNLEYYAAEGLANPEYVWNDASPAASETVYFAQAYQYTDLIVAGITRLAVADTFTDNAHTLFIEEYLNIPLVGITLETSVTPAGGAPDGSLSDAGQADSPPFGWQNISKFSGIYVPTLPVTIPALTTYFFVVSYEVVNYSTNGDVNPAGLQFIVELYNDLVEV
ncbi:hypothetical protein N0M98_15385 [Paenibacillus doosanensis]|uniref:Uncharacterized protein n=1 Tax=Paenibacillus konkukensis TaxID=2020716 RepID=A0ABY4REA1_9BACL|nr:MULTISPECIES: hypothetical protein [Paenibacillus]MCS7461534.1 hypothetical protein [Paenibacillus doosanensis]UQZ80976.1 hypothetical protein SK3146_00132 [Paenibacillus konkukensis]